MKKYYKIFSGSRNIYADECLKGNFIGVDGNIHMDLTNKLPDNWRDFNKIFIPICLENNPGKSRISAGLICGSLWTLAKGINVGEIVLSPNGNGDYNVGEVVSGYHYVPNEILPHRRQVKWYNDVISKSDMSDTLKSSTRSAASVSDLTSYSDEIESLIKGKKPVLIINDPEIEDPYSFAMEKHLEEFLVKNWSQTQLGREYVIFSEEGELVGQQYPSDTGPIDVLAISKDKKSLLVVELKKGRASDNVLGQIQRYMGYVKDELAEEGQIVKGVIIALEDDLRIRRALSVTNNIEFFRYQVSFNLIKG